jgi:S1-C subfamily serine protease
MVLTDLDDAARADRGLARDGLALFVKSLGNYGQHGTAKKAGVLKDDVVVALDGVTARLTEGDVIGRLLQKRKAGEVIDVTVRRGAERLSLKLPMQ